MSYGMKRLTLASSGLVQYLNPSLQFGIGAFVFLEPVTQWHFAAFGLIWIALGIYSYEALRRERS